MKKYFSFSLFLILFLLLSFAKGITVKKNNLSAEGSGKFAVKGTLIYTDHKPASDITVYAFVVNEKGNTILKLPDHADLLTRDFGITDEKGKFEFKIDQKYFEGEKIRFTLGVDLKDGTAPNQNRLRDNKGIPLDIQIDYKTKVVDFDKIVGPITVLTYLERLKK